MQKKSSFSAKKTLVSAATGAGLIAGSFLTILFQNGTQIQTPAHIVTEIVDGDTFFTADRLLVRLASTDAPERDECGGPEATKALEKLILGKPVHLHVLFVDEFRRVDSMVYTEDTWVNKEMLEKGYASYPRSHPSFNPTLRPLVQEAKAAKRGIYGRPCTQWENTDNPDCPIKGNVNRDAKTYFRPGCGQYDQTGVELYQGDRWFCTEKEALSAGFKPSQSCK